MSEYVVEPKSRWQLRQLANVLRDKLGLHDTLFFPIVELLDLMCELFDGFSYEIVPDSEFPPDIHEDTNILKQHIRIKESIYLGACQGVGRDRMTIAHEIGHYFAADNEAHESDVYSLHEMRSEDGSRIKNTATYDKQYLEGRYGADPYLRNMLGGAFA